MARSKPPGGPELSDGEWEILKTVWERESCTAPDVQEALAGRREWSYSTVRTMMDRLVRKGILAAAKVRNLTLYRAVLPRDRAQRSELLRTLRRAFDGSLAPMVRLLLEEELSGAELDRIERLLGRGRTGGQGGVKT